MEALAEHERTDLRFGRRGSSDTVKYKFVSAERIDGEESWESRKGRGEILAVLLLLSGESWPERSGVLT